MVGMRKQVDKSSAFVRGEAEERLRQEYMAKQAEEKAAKDAKLGKRLKRLDEFYEESAFGEGQKEMFEPMKKALTQKKKTKKLEKEEEEKEKVVEVDTSKRDCKLVITSTKL